MKSFEFYEISFLEDLKEYYLKTFGFFDELKFIDNRINLLKKVIADVPELPITATSSKDYAGYSLESTKQFILDNFKEKNVTFSFLMIVRDEGRSITRCINSILPFADEIVIVDTGSTDDTLDKIRTISTKKIKIHHHIWQDNFAEARNFAINKASKDWIFFIDADEYLLDQGQTEIKHLISMFDPFPDIDRLAICPIIFNEKGHQSIGVKRIFKNKQGIYFKGSIHEYLIDKKQSYNLQSITLPISIGHDGYNERIMKIKNKRKRNLTLLKKEIQKEPDNPKWYYFIARDGFDVLDSKQIEVYIQKGLALYASKDYNEDQDFTSGLKDLLINLKFNQGKLNDVYQLATELNQIDPDNSDSHFYIQLSQIIEIKKKMNTLLQETMNYRANHFETQYGMIHSEGYHIDLLIGILLFESERYEQSQKYFDFLKNRFDDFYLYEMYREKVDVVCSDHEKADSL